MLKELRQAVRNAFVIATLLGSLLAQLGVVLAMRWVPAGNQGGQLVAWAQYVVIIACGVCLPIYAGARLAGEIWSGQADFYYNTALRADQVICGKLAATRALIVMLASTVMPLTALAYVMRGISLYAAVALVIANVVCALAALHVAVLAGSARGTRAAQCAHMGFGLPGVAVCAGAALRLTAVVSAHGQSSIAGLLFLILFMLTLVIVTRALAIANFSPLQHYRAFAGTVMIAQILALWSVVSLSCAPFGLAVAVALLIGAAERQSARVQAQTRWSASRLPRWVTWWMARQHYRRWAFLALLATGAPYLLLLIDNLYAGIIVAMFVLFAVMVYAALNCACWQPRAQHGTRRTDTHGAARGQRTMYNFGAALTIKAPRYQQEVRTCPAAAGCRMNEFRRQK